MVITEVALGSVSDNRWVVYGIQYDNDNLDGVFLDIRRPGKPSVLREYRRKFKRRGRGTNFPQREVRAARKWHPDYAFGNQTGTRLNLSLESARNLRAVLNHILGDV